MVEQGQGTAQGRARSRGWIWAIVLVAAFIVAPAVGCGACGLSLAVATRAQDTAALAPSVAVIRVEGAITNGDSVGVSTSAGSETIIDLIERAADDGMVRAIVLRVDSPGGGVVPSDEIQHALQQVEKPIVVSMGSLAASGGYYISAPADYIYATPFTLTGSIGVISQFVTAEELLDDLGVEVEVITAGEVKDFGSMYRDMTEEERAYWQALITKTHEGFIEKVAEGRGLPVEAVREVADGRIILGQDAVEIGLADEVGYLDDAIARAADLGGIQGEPNVIEMEPALDLFGSLYGFQGRSLFPSVEDVLGEIGPSLEFRYLTP